MLEKINAIRIENNLHYYKIIIINSDVLSIIILENY